MPLNKEEGNAWAQRWHEGSYIFKKKGCVFANGRGKSAEAISKLEQRAGHHRGSKVLSKAASPKLIKIVSQVLHKDKAGFVPLVGRKTQTH